MNRLFICIETENGNNPGIKGLYPYVEAPDFNIRLIAYSVDGKPVQIVDVAHGENLPEEIRAAIADSTVIKTSYDGAFTRVCLSRHILGACCKYISPNNWECLKSIALCNGFPEDVELLRSVLGMDINPAPSMLRQIRTRIDNISAWKKEYVTAKIWNLYIATLAAELENEIEIAQKLNRYPVSGFERKAYEVTQRVNDRGIMVDGSFISKANKRINAWKMCANDRFSRLTGIQRMCPDEFRGWLLENNLYAGSLSRESLLNLLPTGDSEVDEIITLWTELNRTNLAKYSQIAWAMSRDSRMRGQFRYFGSRTGRFGNESVQLDNLPVSIMSDIDGLRRLTIDGSDTDIRNTGYSIPTLYTELLSTAVKAPQGRHLLTLGYNSLEKKVASWVTCGGNLSELYKEADEVLRNIRWWKTRLMTNGIRWEMEKDRFSISLPSGRKLYYYKPTYDSDGNMHCLCYDDHKEWKNVKLSGRRIVNDIIQAVSRDILVDVLVRLDASGCRIVMFYPGNVVIEGSSEEDFDLSSGIFSESPEWAKELLLAWHGSRYNTYLEISRDSRRNC